MADDPFDVLGLSRGATPQQISEAYRALVQIYHPDRYSEAPPRVRDEALRRMQAVNAAYDQLGRPSVKPSPKPPTAAAADRTSPPPRTSARATTSQRPRSTPLRAVLYVDGSRHYHDAAVAPLGLDLRAEPVRTAVGAAQCTTLDDELSRWFQGQSRNASMTDSLMYTAWDEEQRALYTATVGCSEVLLSTVTAFARPCPHCRPPTA